MCFSQPTDNSSMPGDILTAPRHHTKKNSVVRRTETRRRSTTVYNRTGRRFIGIFSRCSPVAIFSVYSGASQSKFQGPFSLTAAIKLKESLAVFTHGGNTPPLLLCPKKDNSLKKYRAQQVKDKNGPEQPHFHIWMSTSQKDRFAFAISKWGKVERKNCFATQHFELMQKMVFLREELL